MKYCFVDVSGSMSTPERIKQLEYCVKHVSYSNKETVEYIFFDHKVESKTVCYHKAVPKIPMHQGGSNTSLISDYVTRNFIDAKDVIVVSDFEHYIVKDILYYKIYAIE